MEAKEIEHRHDVLMGDLRKFKENVIKHNDPETLYYRKYAGIQAAMMLPLMGEQKSWITPEALRPSRMLDYVMLEELIVIFLSFIFIAFLLCAIFRMLLWRFIKDTQSPPEHNLQLPRTVWLQAIGWGFLLPLALYITRVSVSTLSGREYNIATSLLPTIAAILLFLLWVLIVPAVIVSKGVWRQYEAAGLLPDSHRRSLRVGHWFTSLHAMLWVVPATLTILQLPGAIVLIALLNLQIPSSSLITTITFIGKYFVAITLTSLFAFLPIVWEYKQAQLASFKLARARALALLYASLALFASLLYPVMMAFESHFIKTDRIVSVMDEQGIISFTRAEGITALKMRSWVQRGAEKLVSENNMPD